jgi:hypothetical protein
MPAQKQPADRGKGRPARPKRIPEGIEEGQWRIRNGRAVEFEEAEPFAGEVERLDYSNPFGLELERVWFDGKIVYASELGELDVDPASVKVAQEYQIVYGVELDEKGKPRREPERVKGQYNIYDSVPGMDKYSPLWLFNYVVVPREYKPNTLRSEADCLKSGYPILKSTVIEN